MASQNKSMFGINDCHQPRVNTKKKYGFIRRVNKTVKNFSAKRRGYNYKNIILFFHSLGQTKLGAEQAPRYLNKYINRKKHIIHKVGNTGNMYKNINNLYVKNSNIAGKLINIGGDHSMAIATIADTLNKHANAKVIYFDAHADINTFKSSNSKHYHGMPLSFITGLDSDKRFPFIKNKLPFENILYIGSRCWDLFEIDEVYKKNIKFLTPDDINDNFKDSLAKILDFVGDSPIHVSFDVDIYHRLERQLKMALS